MNGRMQDTSEEVAITILLGIVAGYNEVFSVVKDFFLYLRYFL